LPDGWRWRRQHPPAANGTDGLLGRSAWHHFTHRIRSSQSVTLPYLLPMKRDAASPSATSTLPPIPSAACRCRHRRRRPEDAGLALRSRPGSDWSKLEWICSHSAGIMINQLLPTADHGATRRSHCHCRLQADHCLLRTPIDAVRFQTIQNCHLIQSICAAQASADCLGCMRGCEFFGLSVDK